MLVTDANFPQAMTRLEKSKHVVMDLETTGLEPYKKQAPDRLCGVAFLDTETDEAYYMPFRHGYGQNLSLDKLKYVGPALARPEATYTGFNYKFDMQMMHADGGPLPSRIEEVQAAAHLMNENELSFALKNLGEKYLSKDAKGAQKELKQNLGLWGGHMKDLWKMPPHLAEPYACEDVRLTWKLRNFYMPHLEQWGLTDLWRELNDYTLLVAEMEIEGMNIDFETVDEYVREATQKEMESVLAIKTMAKYPINPGSPKQVCAWLGIPNSEEETLEAIEHNSPGARLVLDYRGWSGVKSRYYTPFRMFSDTNGRCHPNFRLFKVITGRLSCGDPINWQAMPRRTEVYKVKDVVVCEPGWVLVEADYSQAELRVASHYGKEMTMAALLARGVNIHQDTADNLHLPYDVAKRINFSVVYGIGAKTLGYRLHVPEETAAGYLAKYHARYPGFKRLYYAAQNAAEQRGYIRMYSGRLRHFNVPNAEFHKASSNLVQGSVGEMIRKAQLRIKKDCPTVKQLLQIHDSTLFKVREEELFDVLPVVKRAMEDTPWCMVPMKVELKFGSRWGAMVKWDAG